MKKTKLFFALGIFAVFTSLIIGTHFLNKYAEKKYYSKLKTNRRTDVILKNTPPRYSKTSHVTTDVKIENSEYHVRYGFKDHNNMLLTWEARFSKGMTDRMVSKFGVPSNFFEPYYLRDDVIAKRKRQMEDGMWSKSSDYIVPDMNAMATYYRGFAKPIAQFMQQSLGQNATWRNQLEFTLRFCQDIPYGIPPDDFGDKKIGEIFTPAQTLVNLYADCDSKAVLFAAIMSYFEGYEMIYVHVPGHVLLATKGVPSPYDYYFTYKNQKYIYTESVGPGRFAFGRSSSKYRTINKIIPVVIGEHSPVVNATLISSTNSATADDENTNRNNSEVVDNTKNGDVENETNTVLSNPDNKPVGDAIFWTDSSAEGQITVFLNGIKMGVITSSFDKQPTCEGLKGLRFSLPIGNYQMKAESDNGSVWEGELEIQAVTCHSFAF